MKRMFITAISVLVASAALAAPASAQTTSSAFQPPAVQIAVCQPYETAQACAKRIISYLVVSPGPISLSVCDGEPIDVCLERIINDLDPVGTVFDTVRLIGTVAGQAIVLARDTANYVIATAYNACDDVISTCDPSDMPVLPLLPAIAGE